MSRIYNRRSEKDLRKELRNTMPSCEIILWSRLRAKQIHNCKFRRQFSFGPYVVDFYCPELKLAIEIDGDSHFGDGAEIRDAARQASIESYGVHFLRFTNVDVRTSLYEVLNRIGDMVLRMRDSARSASQKNPPVVPPC